MGDIFDDVMDAENADLDAKDVGLDSSDDSNFNESELQDIMAEIDNLEKDFAAEPQAAPIIAKKEIFSETVEVEAEAEVETEIEAEIDAEIDAEIEAEIEEVFEETPIAKEVVETKVLSFEKKSPIVTNTTTDTHSNVSLAASGDMSLNLTFKIGDEEANLVIDKEKGLHVVFSGVELTLHATNGCTVQMANGVSLNVPVKVTDASTSKKAI